MGQNSEPRDGDQPKNKRSSVVDDLVAELGPEVSAVVSEHIAHKLEAETTPDEDLAEAIVRAVGVPLSGESPRESGLSYHERRRAQRSRKPGVHRAIQVAIRAGQIARAVSEADPESADWEKLEAEIDRLYLAAFFHGHEGQMARRMVVWDAIEQTMLLVRRERVFRAVVRKMNGEHLSRAEKNMFRTKPPELTEALGKVSMMSDYDVARLISAKSDEKYAPLVGSIARKGFPELGEKLKQNAAAVTATLAAWDSPGKLTELERLYIVLGLRAKKEGFKVERSRWNRTRRDQTRSWNARKGTTDG